MVSFFSSTLLAQLRALEYNLGGHRQAMGCSGRPLARHRRVRSRARARHGDATRVVGMVCSVQGCQRTKMEDEAVEAEKGEGGGRGFLHISWCFFLRKN